jgi:hypothetical protein
MWYAQETRRFMDEGVLYDINNVCVYDRPFLSALSCQRLHSGFQHTLPHFSA